MKRGRKIPVAKGLHYVLCRLRRLCAELETPFLDLYGPLFADTICRAEAMAGDGAHPNAGGYARAATLVEAWTPWLAWTSWYGQGVV